MKKILVIGIMAVAGLMLCGCEEKIAPNAAPKEDVKGGFGYLIGAQIDSTNEVTTNAIGMMCSTIDLDESERPLRWVYLDLTTNRVIYCIRASTGKAEWSDVQDLRRAMVARLADKYGLCGPGSVADAASGDGSVMFGHGRRNVLLSSWTNGLDVAYTDGLVASGIENRIKARENKRLRSITDGL